MRIFLTLALLLASCSPLTPDERGITVDRDLSALGVPVQSKALLELEGMAEDHYSVSLANAWQDAVVWWTTTKCPKTLDPAVIYQNGCYYGRMWSCDEIYVALPRGGTTCGSALLHEYGHCLRMLLFGDGDAGHKSDIWELVAVAHERACVREAEAGAMQTPPPDDVRALSAELVEKCEHDQ